MDSIFDIEASKKLQQHYTVKQVAEMFAVSTKSVYRWLAEHRIKGHRIAGSVRIPKSELVKLVETMN
ncbi:MAG TPA: helix-turn-helix domain-containing protein [bacterium]|nr:helix-turn-helix domain-containing protein [bacterium]HNT67170.1 helix-turn-helix domain-containing protein [bacterium]HOX85146.1 helix-turn-helix domain-containing protein [bacterium]HPG47069.1 helix-turn-helix domain-containing protein [bacterium]HPM99343.1 helix-turn-helix domain-containing protein [bacterium]